MSVAHDSLLYSRVETVLASEIADGDLKVGEQLPTEDNLIERFGVSRITVRRAIQNLVSRSLVEIRRGKGTFVATPKITQELRELSGFVEDMHALGRKPTARLIGKEIVAADATVASQLALTKGERVVRIRRVRLADGIPLSFDETFLPLEIGKKEPPTQQAAAQSITKGCTTEGISFASRPAWSEKSIVEPASDGYPTGVWTPL